MFIQLTLLGLAAAGAGKPTIISTPVITEDYAKHFPASEETSELNCVLPEMSASGKSNNPLSVQKRIFLIDNGRRRSAICCS